MSAHMISHNDAPSVIRERLLGTRTRRRTGVPRCTFSPRSRLRAAVIAVTAAAAFIPGAPAFAQFPQGHHDQGEWGIGEPYTELGCTVTPRTPKYAGLNSKGEELVRFEFWFGCRPGVSSVEFTMRGLDNDEYDSSATDVLFTRHFGPVQIPNGSGYSGSYFKTVPVKHWDGLDDPVVEPQTAVKYKVCAGPVCAEAPDNGSWWITSYWVPFLV